MRIARAPLSPRRLAAALAAGALVLAAALAAGALFGASGVGWASLAGGLDAGERAILVEVRLPRVAAAAALGAALSLAGVAFQALLRNPLADPYVLGVSGGASLGGVVALVAGVPGAILPLAAFAGALATLAGLERLATVGGRLDVLTLLLTGAVFNATSAAAIVLVQVLASREELHAVVAYLLGRVPVLGGGALAALGGAALLGALALGARGRSLNALALGEEGAMQVGVDVERLKRGVFVVGALLTALAVSWAGLVGFVGLVVPHLVRRLFGPDHRLLAPLAALGGAAFLVVADLVARLAMVPRELPVGAITALVGGPFFLVVLRRRREARGG
ncbi:MAG TPA: iron ABC transporter permease [Thermoanaerobaculia bacterium]